MNYLLSAIFAAAGIACFIWYKPLYQAYAKFMAGKFRDQFGKLAQKAGWDDPENNSQIIIYKTGIVCLGVFFLAMSIHFAFGPIHI